MDFVLDIFFAMVALLTAHQAGAAYILSKSDPAKKRSAIIGTLVSVCMISVLIIRS